MSRPLFVRQAVSILLVALVFLVRSPLIAMAGEGASPVLYLYLPVVTIAAWYGGLWPGLTAVALGGLLRVYFDIEPIGSFQILSSQDCVRVAIFVAEGVLLSALMELLHSARRASEAHAREADRYREASRRETAKLQAILDNSSTPIWMKDAQGHYLLVNRRFEAIAGGSQGTIVGKTDSDLHLPRIAGALHANDREVLDRARAVEVEEILLLDDGPHTFLSVKFPFLDARGKAYAIGGISTDITQRKRAERELGESEERFRTLSACSPVGVFLTDADGRTTYTNARCREIFGFSGEEAEGDGWTRYIHPEDRDRVSAAWDESRKAGIPYSQVYRTRESSGRIRWVHDRTAPLLSDRGLPIGHVGTVEDITEQKEAEDALRRERDFAEGLIQTAQVIVLVLDLEGRVVRVNPFLERVAGHRPDEVRGEDWFGRFVAEEDREAERAAFRRAIAEAVGVHSTRAILDREGRERVIDWAYRSIEDAPGEARHVLAIGHDITDLKLAQRRSLQAGRLAALGQMVTGLAHESRNALQRSQACLEMLTYRLEGQPEAMGFVAGIQHAQDDLQFLYEEVRCYAAPIVLERRPCDLRDLLREAWDQLEPARRGRVASLTELGLRSPRAPADAHRLVQVFRNVLDNSLAACHDPLGVEVEWSGGEIDGRPSIRVALRDDGPGLSPEARRNFFEPFFTTKTQGTGLGMAIARRIVDAHGGSISIGDGGRRGAEIVINLPGGEPCRPS